MAPYLESDSSIYNEFMKLSKLLPAISSILLSKFSMNLTEGLPNMGGYHKNKSGIDHSV